MSKLPHRQEPIINMRDLARRIDEERTLGEPITPSNAHQDYAPQAVRNLVALSGEPAIQQIKRFAELPTTQIDDVEATAEATLAELKARAQAIRDYYTRQTDELIADIKRFCEGSRIGVEMMKSFHDRCKSLNDEPDDK